jgi:hypothetical protein
MKRFSWNQYSDVVDANSLWIQMRDSQSDVPVEQGIDGVYGLVCTSHPSRTAIIGDALHLEYCDVLLPHCLKSEAY